MFCVDSVEDEPVLITPEGELRGVVPICKYLVKDTPLCDGCSYLEKSQVCDSPFILLSRNSLLPAESCLSFLREV